MYDNNNDTLSRGWGVFNKGLYGEAPPRGPTPYPFIYHFLTVRKSIFNPFVYLLWQMVPGRYPFHIPSLALNIPVNCCKFTVFTCNTWINRKANSFSRLFHKTASFSPFGPFYRPKWQISLPETWKRSTCESYDFHIHMTFISLHLQWGSKVLTLLQNDPVSEQWTYLSPPPV